MKLKGNIIIKTEKDTHFNIDCVHFPFRIESNIQMNSDGNAGLAVIKMCIIALFYAHFPMESAFNT